MENALWGMVEAVNTRLFKATHPQSILPPILWWSLDAHQERQDWQHTMMTFELALMDSLHQSSHQYRIAPPA